MPSANGVYSLPTGYLAVTGATILASQHNPPLEDIAAALTLRLSRDGTAAMTGALQFSPGTVTAPGAVFSTDASSGFYKTTNGIGVSILGTQVAEFLAGGVSGSRVTGEVVPFTGSNVPSALWVFPFGQTLSRTTYPTLWTFAQAEIAAGSLLYNNGDGSTTFGIPDMRGRVSVFADGMGGTAASRTTNLTMTPSGTQLGSVGGVQAQAIAQANLPAISLSGSISGTITGTSLTGQANTFPATGGPITAQTLVGGNADGRTATVSGTCSGSASVPTGGSGTALPVMQPSLLVNCILFVGGQS